MTNTETKLQIYMPAVMREQVHQAAEALRISESEWIRRAISAELGRRDTLTMTEAAKIWGAERRVGQ